MRRRNRDGRGGIFWGLVLVTMGVGFLLVEQGVLPRHLFYSWWTWWPVILIAIGLSQLIRPIDARQIGGGVTMILIGFWFLACKLDWWGLSIHDSWPLVLVAVGAGMMTRSVAHGLWRDREEKEESRVE